MPNEKLKLFAVKFVRNDSIVMVDGKPAYFDNKMLAKRLRNELQEETDEAYAVILGPDHHRFSSDGSRGSRARPKDEVVSSFNKF